MQYCRELDRYRWREGGRPSFQPGSCQCLLDKMPASRQPPSHPVLCCCLAVPRSTPSRQCCRPPAPHWELPLEPPLWFRIRTAKALHPQQWVFSPPLPLGPLVHSAHELLYFSNAPRACRKLRSGSEPLTRDLLPGSFIFCLA